MRDDPKVASVRLDCAECWYDEADDAVQEHVWGSPDLIPIDFQNRVATYEQASWGWNSNTEAVWAFAAMCVEEGFDEQTGLIDGNRKQVYNAVYAPIAIAQRDGDSLRATWLGGMHRPWLDRTNGFIERVHGYPKQPEMRRLALAGNEHELVENLLAGDDGAL